LYSYQLPVWWQTKQGALTLLAGGMVLLVMLAVAVWYLFFYRPPLTLTQWRTRELQALSDMLEAPTVNYKRFFSATTFFLKQYLLRLYGWQVLDKTDDELMAFVATKREVPKKLLPRIEQLLCLAQMVKFADQQALASNADEALSCLDAVVGELKAPEGK